MTLRNRTVIIGVGESDAGRLPHMSGHGLTAQAARRAIADAGIKYTEIDGRLYRLFFYRTLFHAELGPGRIPWHHAALWRRTDRRRGPSICDAEPSGAGGEHRSGRRGAGLLR